MLPAGLLMAMVAHANAPSLIETAKTEKPQTESVQTEPLEEVVVTGRLPGPPLWKVSKGDHVLWIFPHVGFIPREMQWDSTRVERIIAGAQEYLPAPVASAPTTVSMNPVSVARAWRAYKKSTGLPEGQTLADIVPPALYQRFEALKARYLPGNKGVEKLEPEYVFKELSTAVVHKENLAPPGLIFSRLDKFVKRNDSLRITDTSVRLEDKVGIKELKQQFEDEKSASPREADVACFEARISFLEDLGPIKKLANAWAQGKADELLPGTAPSHDEANPCDNLSQYSRDRRDAAISAMREKWLTAAEVALAGNRSTFAVLGLYDVVAPNGLVAQLQAKGYLVEISGR